MGSIRAIEIIVWEKKHLTKVELLGFFFILTFSCFTGDLKEKQDIEVSRMKKLMHQTGGNLKKRLQRFRYTKGLNTFLKRYFEFAIKE
jgi:hypothetical protein